MERHPDTLPWRELGAAWRDAVILAVISAVAAFSFNALRPEGIPVIRYAPFDLLGPCPEIQGDIPMLAAEKLHPEDPHVRVLDVRMPWEYAAGHIPGALSVPLYETSPLEPERIEALKRLPAGTWIVVADDTGGQLAKRALSALAAAGVRGLHVLEGGVNAWQKHSPRLESTEIPIVETMPDPPGNARVVDARPEDAEPVMPQAEKLPFDDLLPPEADTIARLRKRPDAPIYVVGDRELPADPAHARPVHPAWGVAAQLQALGFSRVFVVKKPVMAPSKETAPPGDAQKTEDVHE